MLCIPPKDAKINAITSSASCKDKKFAITLTNADNNSKRTVKIDLNGFQCFVQENFKIF